MNRDEIEVGGIFHLNLTRDDDMIIPDKEKDSLPKFIVIVGFVENVKYESVYCVISTLAYEPKDEQFPILKSSYPKFKEKKSNLDLSRVRIMKVDRIVNSAKYIDTLTDEDKKLILEHLRQSEFFSNKKKKLYGWIE